MAELFETLFGMWTLRPKEPCSGGLDLPWKIALLGGNTSCTDFPVVDILSLI